MAVDGLELHVRVEGLVEVDIDAAVDRVELRGSVGLREKETLSGPLTEFTCRRRRCFPS